MDLWYLYNGECFISCPTGFFESTDSGLCLPCSKNCLSCEFFSDNCTTCQPYYELSQADISTCTP